jgi:epoxyqueuosine reductase
VIHAGDGLRSPDPLERARAVLARCSEHGFAVAGIAEARPSAHAEAYRAWIAEGKQGGMGYLAEEIERRLDPGILVPGARSVLCVADRYADGRPDRREPGMGRIARYSRGEDYHVVIRARLEALAQELARAWPGQRFRVCVDTAPLLEREHAERAGVGRIGKHTLLIAPGGMGSWVLLGAIVSSVEFSPVRADGTLVHGFGEGVGRDPTLDPCGSCTRCIDACPTGAITSWSVDARRCISAITIEERGRVATELVGRTGDWIFGCDDCQEACPHSQPTNRSRATGVHEAYRGFRTGFPLLDLLGWDEAAWEAALLTGVLRRADASMWRRNAALAAAAAIRAPDTPEPLRAELRAALAAVALDARATTAVRDAARDALRDAGS